MQIPLQKKRVYVFCFSAGKFNYSPVLCTTHLNPIKAHPLPPRMMRVNYFALSIIRKDKRLNNTLTIGVCSGIVSYRNHQETRVLSIFKCDVLIRHGKRWHSHYIVILFAMNVRAQQLRKNDVVFIKIQYGYSVSGNKWRLWMQIRSIAECSVRIR